MSITREQHFGGAETITIGREREVDLHHHPGRMKLISADEADSVARLPSAELVPRGGPQFHIKNTGGHAIEIVDAEDNTLRVLQPGAARTVVVLKDGRYFVNP
jgi:hypothetical protein